MRSPAASASSAETSPVAAILPAVNVLPQITGLLQDGQLLSVGTGSWSGSEPLSYSYRWQACNAVGKACSTSATTPVTGLVKGILPSNAAVPSIGGRAAADHGDRHLDGHGTDRVLVTATNVAGATAVPSAVTALIPGLGLNPVAGAVSGGTSVT